MAVAFVVYGRVSDTGTLVVIDEGEKGCGSESGSKGGEGEL